MREPDRKQPSSSARLALLAVLGALVFTAYVRLRVADVPFERDEGEYAYAGQLVLQGIPPYQLAYNMKFPGTYYAYALILAVFGQTAWGIHTGLLLVNAATILFVFAVGRRLLGEFGGAAAAVSFAVLSIDRWPAGVFAHATHFVILAAMAGLWLLLRAIENERRAWFVWSGALFGVAVLMKQHAVFLLPFAAAVVWSDGRAVVKRIGAMALGAAAPVSLVVVVLAAQGALGRFWFWTFQYARAYVSEVSVANALPNLLEGFKVVSPANRALWILAGFGLIALWATRWNRKERFVLTGLLVASFVAMCPGFYFRQHYFILVFPAAALLCGVAVASLRQMLERSVSAGVAAAVSIGVLVAPIGLYVIKERHYLFSMGTQELSRKVFGSSPFIEAVAIAKYIKDHSSAGDRIAVLGSEPEIYFYAGRKAATGYIYTYALMEPQPYAKTMQEEMIREIEAAHPLYLVFPWIESSWLARKESDQGIVSWGRQYIRQCYDLVGVADIISEGETRMLWDAAAQGYAAQSSNLVYTFKRKSDAACAVSR